MDLGNFYVKGYFPLIGKDTVTHSWSFSLYDGGASF